MAAMTDPRELLLHELKDIYYVEKALVKTLPNLSREATDRELRKGLDKHLGETKRQVANIEKVFRSLGEQPTAEQCPGFDGIKQEHDEFMREEQPSTAVRDIFLTGAAARTEHYEIAAYTGMIALAKAIGEKEAADLLDKNLKQEKEALKTVESAGRRISRETAKQNGRATAARSSRSRSGSSSRSSGRRASTTTSRGTRRSTTRSR
jgi:ferritin-like metal-binding protein YciE